MSESQQTVDVTHALEPVVDARHRRAPRLGDLLVAEGVISPKQLDKALEFQKQMKTHRKLGQVLVELRITSEQRIQDTIKKHGKDFRIGELLILLDLITHEQLDKALEYQKEHPGRRIGEIVQEKKFVNERQLLLALAYHFDRPFIEPDVNLVDIELIKKMSVPYLKRMEAIPVFSDGEVVTVITADPTREEVAKEFSDLLRMPVELGIASRDAILQTCEDFEHLYKSGQTDKDGRPEESVISIVDYILAKAVREGASDIHIEPMENRVRVRYRIDGVLVHKTDLPSYLAPKISSRIKILARGNVVEKRKHQGGRIVFVVDNETVDMRVSVYVSIHGENVVIRVLNKATGVLPMEKLGMLPSLLQRYKEMVLDVPTGVVLFTGPTGSGKTTSLYSSINYCNDMGVKIITAEDPVEYIMDGIVQCSIDTAAGRNFAETLREIVRQDPDVIVLGEIRDKESANIAIEAALTGHKVFATFHTEDSIGSLVRLIDMEIETFLISSTVVCVVAQRLVRRICPNCKTLADPTPYEIRLLGLKPDEVAKHKFYKGEGCHMCNRTGYRGRVGLYEMLLLDDSIRELILAKRPSHEIRARALQAVDLFTLQEDGIAKAMLGQTTLEEIISHAPRNYHEQRSLDTIWEFAEKEPD